MINTTCKKTFTKNNLLRPKASPVLGTYYLSDRDLRSQTQGTFEYRIIVVSSSNFKVPLCDLSAKYVLLNKISDMEGTMVFNENITFFGVKNIVKQKLEAKLKNYCCF